MNQDNIRIVLGYCKLNIKYFEVSHIFESIYIDLIYTSEMIQRLDKIAEYESRPILECLCKLDIDSYDSVLTMVTLHSAKRIFVLSTQMWNFINMFLDHFSLIQNRFVEYDDNVSKIWKYCRKDKTGDCLVYFIKKNGYENLVLIDTKFNEFLAISNRCDTIIIHTVWSQFYYTFPRYMFSETIDFRLPVILDNAKIMISYI